MNATAQKKIVPNKVLVTGASGLLGVAAIEKFLSAGWEVVGVSRRKPDLPSGRDFKFLSVDLRNEEAAGAATRSQPTRPLDCRPGAHHPHRRPYDARNQQVVRTTRLIINEIAREPARKLGMA
jgi:nucleoside-diphosphate-sugar epimerase